MDISPFISNLLLEHDCVVVPGFGGFLCNYQSAEVHPVQHTMAPPSRAISFNRNLTNNDGLLVHHIAATADISKEDATSVISDWVNASKNFLRSNEEVVIAKVGILKNDIENNIQFFPDCAVNYLKSSFGLRTIKVPPVMRGKEIEFTEKFVNETKQITPLRKPWKLAAAIALFASLGVLAQLMYSGKQIDKLNLDQGSVFNWVSSIFKVEEPQIKPLPIEVVETESTDAIEEAETDYNNISSEPVENSVSDSGAEPMKNIEETKEQTDSQRSTYYIMTGAFLMEKNIEAAKQRMREKYPDSIILIEKGKRLTKFGYSVGSDYQEAVRQLQVAKQTEDSMVWLLRK